LTFRFEVPPPIKVPVALDVLLTPPPIKDKVLPKQIKFAHPPTIALSSD
jgi:hypothetical protein